MSRSCLAAKLKTPFWIAIALGAVIIGATGVAGAGETDRWTHARSDTYIWEFPRGNFLLFGQPVVKGLGVIGGVRLSGTPDRLTLAWSANCVLEFTRTGNRYILRVRSDPFVVPPCGALAESMAGGYLPAN